MEFFRPLPFPNEHMWMRLTLDPYICLRAGPLRENNGARNSAENIPTELVAL